MPYNINQGQSLIFPDIYRYTANIVSYDGTTKIATLDSPVNVSLGFNNAGGTDVGHSINSEYSLQGNVTSLKKALHSGGIPKLSTDELGNFVGIFNVPPDRFQTGQRVFRVDNRTGSDTTSATTWAEATFTAQGLSQKTGTTNFSPAIDSSVNTFVQTNQQSNQLVSNINVKNYGDPIAQTFIVSKDNYPNGIYIRSVKLFFKSKPSTNIPIKLSVVGTLNGYPNGIKLDHSQTILNTDHVQVSNNPHYLDSTTYTEFFFDAPVYIQPGIAYAFMLETNSSDYQIYFAEQNKIAIPSTAKEKPTDVNPPSPSKVGSAPYIGALFESQNGQTWTAEQTKSLMFVIDRCIFNTSLSSEIDFIVPKGLPSRKLGKDDIQYSIDPRNVPNVYANFIPNNIPSDAINLTTTDFTPTGTNIQYTYTATLADGNIPIGPFNVSPGKYGVPTANNINYNDGQGERVLLKAANSTFKMSATLSSSDPNLSPIISDEGTTLYNIRYIINNMGIQNNVVSLTNVGSGYYNVNTISVLITDPDIGSDPAILDFTANTTSGEIENVYVVYPGSGYLTTPTVTITDANTTPGTGATVVVAGETSSGGGNSYARYFTKKVTLSPENDSGDLRVYITAWKPFGTNVYVYYKILNRADNQIFEDTNWKIMTQVANPNVFSTQSRDDLIEYEYAPGINNIADNFVSYTGTEGKIYTSFSQFAIKIVMSSNDNTQVPFLTDMRALALPSGTGL